MIDTASKPHCDVQTLIALASGDLPSRRRRRVEAHLNHCELCSAEFARIAQVWAVARTAGAPVQNADAVRAAIAAQLPLHQTRKPTMLNIFTPGRLAFGGLTTVAALSALWLVPGTPVRPLPAFADVERAMQGIETATWAEYSYYGDSKTDRNLNASVHTYTMRMRPEPLMISRTSFAANANGKGTREMIIVVNPHGRFSPPDPKSPVRDWVIWDRNKQPDSAIREKLFFTSAEQARSGGASERDAYGYRWTRGPWKREGATLNGRPVLRFTRHEERRRDDTVWWRKRPPGTADSTLYVDPQTYRIVRAETRYGGSFSHHTVVRASFRYNVPVEENVASVLPPVGRTVAVTDLDLVGRGTRQPSPKEVSRVKATLTQAAARWGTASFADIVDSRFDKFDPPRSPEPRLQNRRLGLLRQTRTRNQELNAIAREPGRAKLWQTFRIVRVIETRYSSHYPYTSPSQNAPFPVAPAQGMYHVIAVVEGVTRQGKTVTCPARFEVRPDGSDLRLTTTAFFPDLPASEAANWTSAAMQKQFDAEMPRFLAAIKSGAKPKKPLRRRYSNGVVG